MEIVFLLILLSIILLIVACFAFFWAIQQKQFDDLDIPAKQILEPDYEINMPHKKRPGDD